MAPWDCSRLDFITQLPVTRRGIDAIMVVVDKLTKMVHLIPTTTTCTAVAVCMLKSRVNRNTGCPPDAREMQKHGLKFRF